MSNENTRVSITDGKYKVRALDAVFGYSSQKETEQIGVQLEITEGEFKGMMLTWYGYFTEASEERTIQSMRHLGWTGIDMLNLSSMFTGKEAQADVVIEEFKDEETGEMVAKPKVEWINGIGVLMKKKMEGAALTKFAQRMKGLASRVGGTAANAGGGNAGGGAGPSNASRGNAGPSRGRDDAPPPGDNDAPPWGGNSRGGQQGGYRR